MYAYLKHFALNDQESYREGVCVWANEQTIREIYLKPYQIVMEAKAATSVMTGFNRIGVLWTSNQGFIESVMRKEWGSHGISVTDWWTGSYMNLAGAIYDGKTRTANFTTTYSPYTRSNSSSSTRSTSSGSTTRAATAKTADPTSIAPLAAMAVGTALAAAGLRRCHALDALIQVLVKRRAAV